MNPDPTPTLPFPEAPAWSHYAGLGGKAFVFAAVVFFLLSIFGWWSAEKKPNLAKIGKWGFWLGCVSLFGAFGCLTSLFLGNQFQFEYVYSHADAGLQLKYKIAAIWSGQQGSFLLWACCSAIFGLLAAPRTGAYRRWFTIPYALFLASIGGILAYETPFNVIPDAIQNGKTLLVPTGIGLNASLQNYWVVIHPPTIFMGFGSLTVLFCWAISAMLNKDATSWVRMVRPWALASLAVLGLGLCMGGFWAYETLNWGGFWAWDPVENVSFVPWVFTAAFVHGLIIQAAKGRYVASNLLLGGLPFLLFVYGTFLTRSGFLGDSSVHSFAEMNRVALWILLSFLGLCAGAFLWFWFRRGRALGRETEKASTETEGVNREGLYRTGILLLTGIAAATAIGMSAPVFTLLVNGRNSRPDEALYHQVLSWFYIPTIVLIGLAPFARWRSSSWKTLFLRVLNIVTLSVGLTGFALLAFKHPDWGMLVDNTRTTTIAGKLQVTTIYWVSFLIFLTLFAAIANLWRMVETFRKSPMSLGGFVAHIGIAVFMAGMILSRGFETNEQLYLQKSVPAQAKMGYTFSLAKDPDPNKLQDTENKLVLNVTGPDRSFVAEPTLYYKEGNDGNPMWTSWPHIQRFASHDVYIAIGAPQMAFWKVAESFKPGETRTVDTVKVTYHGSKMEGQPGQLGTKFIGNFTVEYKNPEGEVFTHDVSPSLELTNEGMEPTLPVAGFFRVALSGINPADNSATIRLMYREAMYPIDLYYKPMTGLVWGGAGILTLGGLMAAFYRRVRRASPESGVEATPESVPSTPNKDALIPVS